MSGSDKAVVVLNNGTTANSVTVPVGAYFANGTTLQDALSGASYTVSGGNVTLPVAARSGAILLEGTATADSTPPTASATRSPAANGAGWNNSSPVTVTLSGSDSGSGVKELRYWIDNGPVVVVSGGSAAIPVSVSGTVVSVRAIDQAGNGSAVATLTVRIDTVAPDTTISASPPALSNSSSASFGVSSNESVVTFECKLDSGTFAPCSTPINYNALGEGSHTFSVRALDVAGNVDASPATFIWAVDTIAPESTLLSGPASLTALTSAAFAFESDEAGSTFQCSLDGGELAPCSSPVSYSALDDGGHTFEVVATDASGNSDASPASYAWSVDTIAPDTTLDSTPPALSNSGSASFGFASSEGGSSFVCLLDGESFEPCTSPTTFTQLADGSHTFEVAAADAAGNADNSPVSYTWTVDTLPGDTVIDSAPPALTNSSAATFAFAAEVGSTFECSLDGAAFAPCTSPDLLQRPTGGGARLPGTCD